MGKSSEMFLRISEIKAQLENLNVEQLKSLLPAASWEYEHAINELIKEKTYDSV